MKKILFILFFALPHFLLAQITALKGVVVDSLTLQPLPYVTIIINGINTQGASSDSAGNFYLKSQNPITSLTCSFVGFTTKHITFKPGEKPSFFTIRMAAQESELDNVVIVAGENPANRIIRTAVNNRFENNYANLNSYTYHAYEKFTFSGIPTSEADDPLKIKLFHYLDEHHILIMESVVDRYYLAPALSKEKVEAQKVSGLQNPNFTLLTSQLQTTNFYDPFIEIATTKFVNPISPNSWDRYFFNIVDTSYSGQDTVYTLTYIPAKGKNFEALKGKIEINSDGYAIQHVVAQPADTVFTTMYAKMEQFYAKSDEVHWFPTQLTTQLWFKKFIINGLMVMMDGKTFITNPKANPPITKKDFDGVGVEIKTDAATKSNDYWTQNRMDTLTRKELNTYSKLDSLGRKNNFDRKVDFVTALSDGNYRLKNVSIQIYNVIKVNGPEGLRLGLGLETNSDLSHKFVLGGFGGYGLNDERWKYGGFLDLKLFPPKNVKLSFFYSKNYEETGGTRFFQGSYWGNNENYRNYTISSFDYVTREQVSFTSRIRKYLNMQLTAFAAHKQILSDYRFIDNTSSEPVQRDHFDFSGMQAAFRFSYKERIVQSLDRYYWINQGYPVIWFQATQGFKGFLNGDFDYTKLESKFEYTFPTRSLGLTSIALVGGWVNNPLPATDLFTGISSYEPIGLYAGNSFQTMRSNEFLDSKYVGVFLQQDFQKNIIRWGKFQPNLVLMTNIGWGTLQHPELQVNATTKSMNQGYFESGFLLNNLLAKKFFGVARLGVGAGAFYRYGPYAFSNPLSNLAVKATWNYSFK
ncbi:MAG: carboxypeptidase-like regulatory domain-containing protein [Chitinophagales bacterium]|nr:carboxypeptidase-like regulatory domain-containing protein [Chitinophagales bacterium]